MDFMSDFVLKLDIEFNIKSDKNSEIFRKSRKTH